MMLIDSSAAGGRSLLPLVKALGVPCALSPLPAGDVAFVGNGPDGPLTVGVERKKVADVIACITDDRFAGVQLPKMVRHYDDRWFVVESEYKPASDGRLLVPYRKHTKRNGPRNGEIYWSDVWGGRGRRAQGWMYRDFILWQLTQCYMGHVHLFRTRDQFETARFVAALYRWWTGKLWHEHSSHLRLYSQPTDAMRIRPTTFFRNVIKELPGIYWKRSKDAEKVFGSVERAINATPEEWAQLGNPRLGEKRAMQLWKLLRAKGGERVEGVKENDNGRRQRQGDGADTKGSEGVGHHDGEAGANGHAPDADVIRGLVERAGESRFNGHVERRGGERREGERRGGAGRAAHAERGLHQRVRPAAKKR